MRKSNYFGYNFSNLKVGGFILASLGLNAPIKAKDESPRKKEATLTIHIDEVKVENPDSFEDEDKK